MAERVLFPESGFTLADADAYYRSVSRVLLPHLKGRPLSFKRYPDTVDGDSFWEKDAPSFTPEWVRRAPVPRRGGGPPIEYIVANDLRTLRWIVGAGGIELHPFLHRAPALEKATHVVFDLDPGQGAGLEECCRVALILRDALETVTLRSFAKVSGSKGLQVYVPLNGSDTHAATETFARIVAEDLARRHPREIVARMTKSARTRRVFIDWSQNADYKTTVAVYSLRTKRREPLVSMPLTWDEVERGEPGRLEFSPDAAVKRIAKRGDLFAPVLKLRQKLPLRSAARAAAAPRDQEEPIVVNGVRLPRAGSQSGRRLFLVTRTEMGNELWLEAGGRFRRWILRPDRTGSSGLIAMSAGHFAVEEEYARGDVPEKWKGRVTVEDAGAYEIVEGSYERESLRLWFTGKVLSGAWLLEKNEPGEKHKSWGLAPVGRA